ncbi:phenylacetate--CoA ligase [Bradyrhizobium sp. KBS0727]|uniref:phenylacetate--CoA ligase n=1 Tax=unclassified Bradyrhizobium TaxID=2631580 RepID=UPI00110F2210|nr:MULTISPECIES: phenylacetate--CoA ligase [unclassified Bradyrhizobium]QDW40450.1 phenylacetate--CoA ligase [Bradyrhizobium sp. KBS0725]QDW47054.1 phenylacetate--CoA ligase [Bradyrhizobium sp. KBS0727]
MRPMALHGHQARMPLVGLAIPIAQEHPMLDIVMLALGLGFFVAGIGYAYACERL